MMIKVLKIISGLILLFNVLALIWVLLYGIVPISTTKLMLIESQQKEIRYQWKPLEEISDKLALAIMCSEDQNFILHSGLDFNAIQQAEEANRRGRSLRGASTITQQVAKNAFLWPDRSWMRKVAELYFALLIDALWSKERIMEVYLNVAELGDGIFGAEAASQHYFNKSAGELSLNQCARLAVILPNPKRYSPVDQTPYLRSRSQWVRQQMTYWGNEMTYDPEKVKEVIGE